MVMTYYFHYTLGYAGAPRLAMEPRWWYRKATDGTAGERARACSFSSLARYLPCCSAT